MSRKSKSKGKRGELELVHELQNLGFANVYRSQQYRGSSDSADLIGIPGIHIECKRTESLSLYQALEQATKDSGNSGNLPAVFHRRNKKNWVVIMELKDWVSLFSRSINKSEL